MEEGFKRKEFPDVSAIPYGQIINQCWLSQVDSAEHVQAFMRYVIRSELNADHIPHLDGLDVAPTQTLSRISLV